MSTFTPSTTPGAIIGHRKDGRPIRLLAGGSEPLPPAPAPTGDPAQPPAAPQGQPPTPVAPPQAPPVPQPPTWMPPPPPAPADEAADLASLPKKWQKEIADLRGENAKNRVTARTETVLRHAYTTAGEHGVNPSALLGSTVFATAASQLDPAAEDFPAKLAEAIQGALTANPWMAAQQAAATPPPPQRSGADFTGTGGTPGGPTIDQQIAEAIEKKDFNRAIDLKRQRAALTQPPPQ